MAQYKLANKMHKTSDKFNNELERLKMELVGQIEKAAQLGKYELSTAFLRNKSYDGIEDKILDKIVSFLKDEWFEVECAEDYYLIVRW